MFKYGLWELLRHEKKFMKPIVLATLLAGNAWLFYGKKSLAYQVSTSYFRIFMIFGGVSCTGLMANYIKTQNSEISY